MCENEMASEAQLRELFPDRMSSDEIEAFKRIVDETIVGFVVLADELEQTEPAELTPVEIHTHMVEMAKGLHELALFTATLLREVKELPRIKYIHDKPVAQPVATGPTLETPVDF
jgi:hypothetical protein